MKYLIMAGTTLMACIVLAACTTGASQFNSHVNKSCTSTGPSACYILSQTPVCDEKGENCKQIAEKRDVRVLQNRGALYQIQMVSNPAETGWVSGDRLGVVVKANNLR